MSAQVSLELHHRISQFLFHEASLLDDWKFRDWLAQLDEEIRYTMRTTVNILCWNAFRQSSPSGR